MTESLFIYKLKYLFIFSDISFKIPESNALYNKKKPVLEFLFKIFLIFSILLKRDSNTGVFFVINAKFLRPCILKHICERLLLKIYPILLFRFLEDNSEVAACQRSAK